MGSILDFIASVNKISLVAFVGVLGFLVYEVNLLRQEQLKKKKPTIPQFNTNTVIDKTVLQKQAAVVTAPVKKAEARKTGTSPLLIAILIVMIIAFLGISAYLLLNRPATPEATQTPTPIIREISSSGIRVYDLQWNEIPEANYHTALKPGTQCYIGIQTVAEADIDRARIKVNQKDWAVQDITMQFNKAKNVYYKEYTVATGDATLKIDAQLHSSTDGWLGD